MGRGSERLPGPPERAIAPLNWTSAKFLLAKPTREDIILFQTIGVGLNTPLIRRLPPTL